VGDDRISGIPSHKVFSSLRWIPNPFKDDSALSRTRPQAARVRTQPPDGVGHRVVGELIFRQCGRGAALVRVSRLPSCRYRLGQAEAENASFGATWCCSRFPGMDSGCRAWALIPHAALDRFMPMNTLNNSSTIQR